MDGFLVVFRVIVKTLCKVINNQSALLNFTQRFPKRKLHFLFATRKIFRDSLKLPDILPMESIRQNAFFFLRSWRFSTPVDKKRRILIPKTRFRVYWRFKNSDKKQNVT